MKRTPESWLSVPVNECGKRRRIATHNERPLKLPTTPPAPSSAPSTGSTGPRRTYTNETAQSAEAATAIHQQQPLGDSGKWAYFAPAYWKSVALSKLNWTRRWNQQPDNDQNAAFSDNGSTSDSANLTSETRTISPTPSVLLNSAMYLRTSSCEVDDDSVTLRTFSGLDNVDGISDSDRCSIASEVNDSPLPSCTSRSVHSTSDTLTTSSAAAPHLMRSARTPSYMDASDMNTLLWNRP